MFQSLLTFSSETIIRLFFPLNFPFLLRLQNKEKLTTQLPTEQYQ